jgi:hypothetical protein
MLADASARIRNVDISRDEVRGVIVGKSIAALGFARRAPRAVDLAPMTILETSLWLKLRRTLALPLYAVALLLDFVGAAVGRLAAWLAGDAWS